MRLADGPLESASRVETCIRMECGEQCVMLGGITMMLELCADNWVTVSAQVGLITFCIGTKINNIVAVANGAIMIFCGISKLHEKSPNNCMPV